MAEILIAPRTVRVDSAIDIDLHVTQATTRISASKIVPLYGRALSRVSYLFNARFAAPQGGPAGVHLKDRTPMPVVKTDADSCRYVRITKYSVYIIQAAY